MQKIKVLHTLHSFGTGGMEKGIATLVQHSSEDIEHVILCMSRTGESQDLLPSGTRVLELHKKEGSSLSFLKRLASEIRREHPDVVHTRNWSGMDGIISARMAGCSGIVHGEHGWGMDDPEGLNIKRLWIRRFTARWVKEFSCVSKSIEQWLKGHIRVKKPVSQIYNGINTDLYCLGPGASIREQLDISPGTFLVGTVGRLDPIKDHPTLFRAFDLFAESFPDSKLIVIGNGPERRKLESEASPDIIFLGNRMDIPELLRGLDIFVLASKNEGISNTILEAMASSLPVIATNVGGNPELVQHDRTGFLVPVGDQKAISGFLERYASDSALRRIHGFEGRRIVSERFSISSMVQSYETIWRRVANGNAGLYSRETSGQ